MSVCYMYWTGWQSINGIAIACIRQSWMSFRECSKRQCRITWKFNIIRNYTISWWFLKATISKYSNQENMLHNFYCLLNCSLNFRLMISSESLPPNSISHSPKTKRSLSGYYYKFINQHSLDLSNIKPMRQQMWANLCQQTPVYNDCVHICMCLNVCCKRANISSRFWFVLYVITYFTEPESNFVECRNDRNKPWSRTVN